ncbi:helix-turn-helix domain-containing protein [Providencia huaxiensis]|uniref:helix-turn-helix domain-containing protein n=1 Tax=Providencia TaxID=586 RepID=UPI002349DFDB|nr:helix-turn-helix domain-containing protein [Providencia sp. PROV143]
MTTPGMRIKKRRLELNLTMSQVAEATGVTRMSISLWENDRTNISAANLKELAKVLKCGTDWIMSGKEEKYDVNTRRWITRDEPTESTDNEEIDVEKIMDLFKRLPMEEQKKLAQVIMERFDYYEQLYTELMEKLDRKE